LSTAFHPVRNPYQESPANLNPDSVIVFAIPGPEISVKAGWTSDSRGFLHLTRLVLLSTDDQCTIPVKPFVNRSRLFSGTRNQDTGDRDLQARSDWPQVELRMRTWRDSR
jgi:hypothetical protein